jgi:cytochrome P450
MASLLYGQKFLSSNLPFVDEYAEAIKLLSEANDPSAYPPLDLLSWLRYIPAWLAPWTEHVKRTIHVRNKLFYGLLENLIQAMKAGKSEPCYLGLVLERQEQLGMSHDEVVFLGSIILDGGTESGTAYLQSLVLALLSFPDAQKKAQEEIDEIVGDSRLPALENYQNLPYVRALVDEVQRFRPLFPIAIPHIATDEISYKQYVIPKGSMLVMNEWGIFHDPELFDAPEEFRPERFLHSRYGTKQGADTAAFRDNLAFGAGRVSVLPCFLTSATD